MTTRPPSSPLEAHLEVHSMTNHGFSPVLLRVTATAGVLGALCLLVSTVLFITDGGGINDGVLGGTVGVWSCVGMAIGSVGIFRVLEPRAPKAAPIAGAVALAGFTGGAAFNVQALFLATYDHDFLADVTEGSGSGNEWFGAFAFLPWGWMVPIGFVLIGWLVWRSGMAPAWVGGLFALGGVLFVTGRPARIDAIAVATDVILVLAFVAIAPTLVRAARSGVTSQRERDGDGPVSPLDAGLQSQTP
jgi:hypothetical protein